MNFAKRSGTPSLVNLFTATSAVGQNATSRRVNHVSALPPKADIERMNWRELETFSFGDNPSLADQLLALVLEGKKSEQPAGQSARD